MLLNVVLRKHVAVLLSFAWLVCLGVPAAAQSPFGKPFRLVAVLDPVENGVATANYLATAATAQRGSGPRAAFGDPKDLRLLLPERRNETEIANMKGDSAEYRLNNSVVLEYDSEVEMLTALMTLMRNPAVLRVSFGGIGRFSSEPLVPISGSGVQYYQWGLYSMNVVSPAQPNGVWAITRGSAYVAVLDNGIKTAGGVHEDLVGSYRSLFSRNYAYLNNGPDGSPNSAENLDETPFPAYNYAGHGTHVAGIIAASNSNGLGGAGICPSCSLFIARVSAPGTVAPHKQVPDWQVVDNAIVTNARRGAQVLNLSFGDPSKTMGDYPDVHDALLVADDRDIVVVAASGNGRTSSLDFPANDLGMTIAVGGIQGGNNAPGQPADVHGAFWTGSTVGVDPFGSNWSASSALQQFVAPATRVLSSIYSGLNWNPNSPYDCGEDYPTAGFYAGYGQCQGTSMAAPHVSGVVALMRSLDPLLDKGSVRDILAATTNFGACTDATKCQLGVPDATAALNATLGGDNVMNRTTPLLSFYSSVAQNHFYTVVPQMAMSALYAGDLLPQPSSTAVRYDPIGSTLATYTTFPANVCGPGTCSNTPKAIALVYTTHRHPGGGADLVPLYRLSYRCGDELLTTPPNAANPACTSNQAHISHFYTTDEDAVRVMTGYYINGVKDLGSPGVGYRLDGIEGFIYSTTVPQPSGTVKLCRKYDSGRDDYVLFPGSGVGGTICTATSDGYTGGNYSNSVGGTDWIGWVRPASDSIGPTQSNAAPNVSITGPANNSVFTQGQSTSVTVSATDSDGSIARVRVYINDALLGTSLSTSSPYQVAWNNMQGGVYVIRALAVDNRGAVKASSTRTVTVNGGNPPDFPNSGGFELPSLSFGTYQANPSGSGFTWSPVDGAGQSGITANHSAFNTWTNCPGTCYQDAPNGVQMAFLQGPKIISKQLLFPFGTYKVRFKIAQRRQNATALVIKVKIDGVEIDSKTATSPSFEQWDSASFTVNAGNHTVTLEGYNPGGLDNSVFIDQLKIVKP